MNKQKEKRMLVIIAQNHLSYNCHVKTDSGYIPLYQLENQEVVTGYSYQDYISDTGIEECSEESEKITISSPEPNIPSGILLHHECKLIKTEDGEYAEVFVCEDDDPELERYLQYLEKGE